MKNVPTHLTHKPIVAVDYEHIDNIAGAGDAMSLSVGEATWNVESSKEKDFDYSAKNFRKICKSCKWSRQSEELPLWRVIDLATLVIAVINDKPSGMRDEVVRPDKYPELRKFIGRNNTMYQKKIANLKKSFIKDTMKKIFFFILVALVSVYNNAYAYDFSAAAPSGQTLYYNIKSSTSVECVGPSGESMGTWSGYSKPAGSLAIPSSVTHSGMTYTVKSIATYAFSECTALTSITIPSSVKRIGSWAFWNDTALHTINLPTTGILWGQSVIQGTGWYDDQPNGIVYLGNTLVGYKGTLPNNYSIVIPSNIKSIAGNAFNPYYSGQSSGSIASITFPNSLEYIGDNAFHDLNITTLTLPNSLKGIGSHAFYGNLFSTITIPNNIEYIGISAFGQCGSLTTVYYNAINANENDELLLSPFYNCSNFTSLHIGSSVQKIPAYIFSNCASIQGTLTLPNSLNSIGQYAFQGCSAITGTLQIKNSVQTIGQMAFYGCTSITTITIGTAVDSIGSSAFGGMTNLTTINYNAINCNYAQNVFYGNNVSQFNIGSSVQTIPDNLILNNSNLTSVTFPNTLTRIGSMNFYMCGLAGTLVLPASLAQVGYGAFNLCTNLTSIQCNATTPPTIETQYGVANAFNNGNWNTPLLVPCSSISAYQSATGWSNFTNISGIGGCNFTVTLSVNNSAMGTVSGGGIYTQGATATITATANSGYRFDHWSDGNTQNPRTITVTQDVTLTAYFAVNTGIEDIDNSGIIVYAKDNQIHIDEAMGGKISVYSIDGRTIAYLPRATEHVTIPVVAGIYIVKIGDRPARKVVVIR